MTEPQVWTMVVGTIGSFVGLIVLVTTWFTRVVSTEMRGVRGEIASVSSQVASVRSELTGEIGSLRREMDVRFEHLDRDVAALMRRFFEPE